MNLRSNIRIKFINIQGLTNIKYLEIEQLIDRDTIMCVIETQQKIDKLNIRNDLEKLTSMRKLNSKKGGGLMLLKKIDTEIEILESNILHEDCFMVTCKKNNLKFYLVIVYMSCHSNENKVLTNAIDKFLQENEGKPFLIIGDLNAHTGTIVQDKINVNGKQVLKWIEDYNLIMVNNETICEGKYTWNSRGSRSVIDYVLASSEMYPFIAKMKIDEQNEIFDLSDHNLIDLELQVSRKTNEEERYAEKLEKDYISTNGEKLKEFSKKLEEELKKMENDQINMANIDDQIIVVAEEKLKVKSKKKRKSKIKGKYEPIWITKEIEADIKTRKKYNRLKRNTLDIEMRKHYEGKYKQYKILSKQKVKEATEKHERKITQEIKKDRNKKLWQNINYLRHGQKKTPQDKDIYEEDGSKIRKAEEPEKLERSWKPIYQQHQNETKISWQNQTENYKREMENENIIIGGTRYHHNMLEHLDMAMETVNYITPMKKPVITKQDVEKQINKMKSNKAPGNDGIKIEIYKEMKKSDFCLEKLTECFNKVLDTNNIPNKWKSTRTNLIPKKEKPTTLDFRPIALTNNSYKICMGIIKSKIEDHLNINNKMEDQQFGFTKGRRTMDSIYCLNFAIDYAKKHKKQLIITFIDFKKAFDSVNRNKLLEMMIRYKFHPSVIDLIINIYNGDITEITKGDSMTNEIEITSGIKQGCTGSTILFLLITFFIIERINEEQIGLQIGDFKIACLFFADDGTIINTSINEATRMINIVEETSNNCGLLLNKEKSCNMICKNEEQVRNIAGIEVVSNVKYLGVEITNGKDIYKTHKNNKIQKAKNMANMITGVIARSSNRLLIGRTYWKNVILPEILYAGDIIIYKKYELAQLQKAENQAFRQIFGAPKFTPVCALRSEVGSSTMETRDKKNKILFYKHLLENDNKMIQKIVEIDENREITKFMKTTKRYMLETDTSKDYIVRNKNNEIKEKLYKLDERHWKVELSNKTSLKTYQEFKNEIKEETGIYDNSEASHILFKARTNTLRLNWRERYMDRNVADPEEITKCPLCKIEAETDIHFFANCTQLEGIRREAPIWEVDMDKKEFVRRLLCFNGNTKGVETLYKLWKTRQKKIEN